MKRLDIWLALAVVAGTGTVRADEPPAPPPPAVLKIEAGKSRPKGEEVLPKCVAAAREVLATTRDYAGFVVRQERVGGVAQPEQVAEIRVRMVPKCVNVRVVKPAALRGEETSYMPAKVTSSVRFKPAGVEGVRGFQTQPLDAPKVLAHTRHPMTGVGLVALLDRVEAIVATERALGHPVGVVASDYQFAGRAVTKCELFADLAHPNRYAARVAIYFDAETKLPVRFEAFDAKSELVEVQSYVGLKRNVGLGDSAFER